MHDKLVATLVIDFEADTFQYWIKDGEDFSLIRDEMNRIIFTDLHDIYDRRIT